MNFKNILFVLSIILSGCGPFGKGITPKNNPNHQANMVDQSRRIIGALSGKVIQLPEVNETSKNSILPGRFVIDGKPPVYFPLDTSKPHSDARSYRRKFGLLIPATNTSMEHELWSIIFQNQQNGLDGIGLHVSNIITPGVQIKTDADLDIFKNQFIGGLKVAIENASLAQPEYLIMGMSLEHIIYGLNDIRSLMNQLENQFPYSWATWHDAADAALKKYKAKRIGLISPFNSKGNENAKKMFEDMGYEVVTTFGFACSNLTDIAHIPDVAKEEAILRYIATPANKLDAVVQLGTNMSMIPVTEKLEKKIGIPVLGINAVTFWYALRENGFNQPLVKSGRLLREF